MADDLKHPVKNIYLLAAYARVSPIYYYRFDETKGVYTYQSNRAGAADYLTFLPLAEDTQANEQAILEPLEFYPLRRVDDSSAQRIARGEELRELMIGEEMSAIAGLEEKEKMLHAELHLIKKEKTEREMRIRKIKAFFKPKAEN